MIAVHLEEGRVEIRKIPEPRPEPGHALLRLLAGGICNTDLELRRGYYGFSGTPGHEFVAEVVEAPAASYGLAGKRVVGEINLACNTCEWCERGLGRHCPNRTVLGIVRHPGAFAEYLTLPVANLRPVPDDLPTEQAVFVEPVAAACEILDQVSIPANEPVAVLGDGKLGLLIAQVLYASGLEVHLYGRHPEKLAIAAARGIWTGAAPPSVPTYNFSVDATGSAQGLAQAVALTRPRGTLVMKSTVHGTVPVDSAAIIVNELTLVGSRCGRFEPALELLASGKIAVDPLISATYPLNEAPAAFNFAATKGKLKVLLTTRSL